MSSEYALGKWKLAMDGLNELEHEVYVRKQIAADEIARMLVWSEPITRMLTAIPEVDHIEIGVSPMYDSTDIDIEVALFVRKLGTKNYHARRRYLDDIETAARLYLPDSYARGIANYVHIRARELDE